LKLDEIAKEIREDRSSGASQLALKAARAFLKLLGEKPSVRNVRRLARILAESRPSMPPIANMAYRVNELIDRKISEGENLSEAIEDAVRTAISEYQSALRMTIENAVDELREHDSILVHSYSSTAAAAIEGCGKLKIYVTESRPGYEGRRLAERLASRGHDVTLVVDAAAAYVLDRSLVDAVVFGCDAILDDCSIANKIGSKMIALAAADAGIPVEVVADSWKAAIHGFSLEEHPSEEVYVGDFRVQALNPYFEVVPSRMISVFVTEWGVVKPQELARMLREMWGRVPSPGRKKMGFKPLRRPGRRA